MAFWGVFRYCDFVSLVTQELFSSPVLEVRNVRIVSGEQALNAEMPVSWSAIHCRDQAPGGLAGKVKCLLPDSRWRAG